MNWSIRDTALRNYLRSNWTATEISWEFWGEVYTPIAGTSFIRPSIVGEAAGQVAKGGLENFYRFLAMLRFCCRFPVSGTTTTSINGTLGSLATLFRGKTIASIGRFHVPTITTPYRDGSWIEYYLEVRFERDEHEAQS